MLSLGPVTFEAVQPWIQDFQIKAHNFENVPNNAELIGIYSDKALAGYFICVGHPDGDLEINQGYLSKEFRHKRMSSLAMQILRVKAKKAGFKKIILASSRTLKAYTQFMASMGYKPERIIFSREI